MVAGARGEQISQTSFSLDGRKNKGGEMKRENEKDRIFKLCLEGLTTDGGHHKQWYLEKILKLVTTSKAQQEISKQLQYESGIAP